MTSDAQRLANRRYYEKNREARLVAMRERAKARVAERNEYLKEHPEEKEERRKNIDQSKKNKQRIEKWLSDTSAQQGTPAFKAFLRANVLNHSSLTKKSLDHLELLAFGGLNPADNIPNRSVDAGDISTIVATAQGR